MHQPAVPAQKFCGGHSPFALGLDLSELEDAGAADTLSATLAFAALSSWSPGSMSPASMASSTSARASPPAFSSFLITSQTVALTGIFIECKWADRYSARPS